MRFAPFTAVAAVALAMLLVVGLFTDVHGQASAPVKVAVASPSKIFAAIQKTTDLNAKLQAELNNFKNMGMQKSSELKDLQTQRDTLRADSPQWAEINRKVLEKTVELDSWGKLQQADLERRMKQQTQALFEEIAQATAEVAASKGIDIVIADQKPGDYDLEKLNIDQLKALLGQRNVLFTSPNADISAAVITAMDAKYKSAK